MARPSPGDRLIARLRAENGLSLPQGARVARTYASGADRTVGAWSWLLVDADDRPIEPVTGSQWRVGDLLRFPALTAALDRSGDRVIDPDATGEEIRRLLG